MRLADITCSILTKILVREKECKIQENNMIDMVLEKMETTIEIILTIMNSKDGDETSQMPLMFTCMMMNLAQDLVMNGGNVPSS